MQKAAGFTPAERANFTATITEHGFIDVFERLNPEQENRFTYFGHRSGGRQNNKGWRLDYFVASPAIADRLHSTWIGSDSGTADEEANAPRGGCQYV